MKYIICIILIIIIVSFVQPAPAAGTDLKIILNFDDGYQGVYDNAFPVMQEYDLPGVVFVITNQIGRTDHLNTNQLRELKNADWEVGSHTICHYNLEELIPSVLKHEIQGSKDHLKELKLIDDDYSSFCSPISRWNKDIEKLVAESYQVARSEEVYFYKNKERIKYIPIIRKTIVNSTDISDISFWIDEAINAGQPLVLVFHDVARDDSDLSYSPRKFKKIINFIKDFRVITFKDLYQKILN